MTLPSLPHLFSPACLGQASDPDWRTPPHIQLIDEHLQEVFSGSIMRLMVNMPYQHGKSQLVSRLFPAWWLLLRPDSRIIIIGHEYEFSVTEYGLAIKDIFNRWGPSLGLNIREDAKAKGSWKVDGFKGGVVCRGWQGGVAGRPADLFIVDDLIKTAEQALSPAIMEAQWRFIQTVVTGRVRRTTPLVMVGTRWTKNDTFGRMLNLARRTGQEWKHLKIKAIAEKDDILGRKPGEPLWPEQVSLEQLQVAQKEFGPWFRAGWQQEPVAEEGNFFVPDTWPSFGDVGGAWTIPGPGQGRVLIPYHDVLRIAVVDWAMTERSKSDYTAIGIFALLYDGRLLVLSMRNERVKLENCARTLAEECRHWQPQLAVVESQGFQAALAIECRRFAEIPEIRQVKIQGKNKLQRAYPAIVMGQNGRILLPDPAVCSPGGTVHPDSWLEDYKTQLAGFTGIDDLHDDMVDVTAYAAQQAGLLRSGLTALLEGNEPCILTQGKVLGGYPG